MNDLKFALRRFLRNPGFAAVAVLTLVLGIGVVKDTREVSLAEKPQPHFYWQYAFSGAQVAVRSATPAAALIPALRETMQQTDPRILRLEFHTMEEIVAGMLAERFGASPRGEPVAPAIRARDLAKV